MQINVSLSTQNIFDSKSDAVAIFLQQNFEFSKISHLVKYHSNLEQIIKDRKFTGRTNSILIIPTTSTEISYLVLVGIGKANADHKLDIENYRRSIGSLVRNFDAYSIKSISFNLVDSKLFDVSQEYLAKQTAIILKLSQYVFDDFITEKDRLNKLTTDVKIHVGSDNLELCQKGIDQGLIIGKAVNRAREWVDLPSNKLTPADLSANAEQIALEYGLECQIFHEEELNKMGMGGISAVASGSEKDARLVIMKYKTEKENAPTLCFVGKGITFDSGGLSIKPAVHMETMKEDMSGAAAVIATMQVLAQFKPHVNIIAVAPLTENMPSGTSVKPGDIVTFYNGKTAEIKNTDAEGRLILADAMSYAVKHFKIDALIDLATLTGACAYALGPFFTGLFSEHDEFTNKVSQAAKTSGEAVWRLPLTNDYKGAVKSEVADLCNIGRKEYQAGATTAACFLQHFVDDVPWVHLDIAGTAFNVPDVSYYRRHSATGVGVRLLVDLAMNWK